MPTNNVPRLITFDGEARSGKGTVAHFAKKQLQQDGLKVMLIDRGQAFRGLVVSAARSGVDPDDTEALDLFLTDELALENTVQLLKDIYLMPHAERDALLYTNEVSVASAKIGARPASQDFVYNLTLKWITDAKADGYDLVLMDGRALDELANDAEARGLCQYVLGLYFVCDTRIGARRTLGLARLPYDQLTQAQRDEVDGFTEQINVRNKADMTRQSQRLVRPSGALVVKLPTVPTDIAAGTDHVIIDTSEDITKRDMSESAMQLIRTLLG